MGTDAFLVGPGFLKEGSSEHHSNAAGNTVYLRYRYFKERPFAIFPF